MKFEFNLSSTTNVFSRGVNLIARKRALIETPTYDLMIAETKSFLTENMDSLNSMLPDVDAVNKFLATGKSYSEVLALSLVLLTQGVSLKIIQVDLDLIDNIESVPTDSIEFSFTTPIGAVLSGIPKQVKVSLRKDGAFRHLIYETVIQAINLDITVPALKTLNTNLNTLRISESSTGRTIAPIVNLIEDYFDLMGVSIDSYQS